MGRRVKDQAFLGSGRDKREYLRARIKDMNIPIGREGRGLGLMTGVEIDGDPREYVKKCCEMGLLILSAGSNVLRFLPPLTITYDELDAGLKILEAVLGGSQRCEK